MNNLQKRESNIELLRIISMILIVAHHFAVHGNFVIQQTNTVNSIWILFLSSGGKIGANAFIMISGYFLINNKKVSIGKFLKLMIQVVFYSITIFIIFTTFLNKEYTFKLLWHHLLGYPVWWFVTSYLALYLFHPYINRFIDALDKKEYRKLILLATTCLSLVPTITGVNFDGGTLIWFIYIYILGGYFKRYPTKLKWPAYKYLFFSLLLYIICFLPVLILYIYGYKIIFASKYATYIFSLTAFPALLILILLFVGFTKLSIKNNNLINLISTSTFGVYLIHDSDYIRPFLWENTFNNVSYANNTLLIPYSILVIIIVFTISSIIEMGRIYLIEKRYTKSLELIDDKIDSVLSKYFKK